MGKVESLVCAAIWMLMSALVVLVAIEPLSPGSRGAAVSVVQLDGHFVTLTL